MNEYKVKIHIVCVLAAIYKVNGTNPQSHFLSYIWLLDRHHYERIVKKYEQSTRKNNDSSGNITSLSSKSPYCLDFLKYSDC